MQKFVIDRNIWLRGEGVTGSFLHRTSDNKQCCVGIFLNQLCNIGIADLTERSTAYQVEQYTLVPEWLRKGPEVATLYAVNDAVLNNPDPCQQNVLITDEAEREKRVVEMFARYDIEVEFIN